MAALVVMPPRAPPAVPAPQPVRQVRTREQPKGLPKQGAELQGWCSNVPMLIYEVSALGRSYQFEVVMVLFQNSFVTGACFEGNPYTFENVIPLGKCG